MIGDLVTKLIDAGTPPSIAAEVVAEAFAAGARSAVPVRTARQERNRRYYESKRLKASENRLNKTIKTLSDTPPDGFPSDSSSLTTPPSPQSEPKEVPLSGGARGARLPIDFEPSDLFFASKLLGSATAADDELERFRDHWKAASGPNAVKRDWNAAWRNWCRRAAETRPKPSNGYHPTGPPPPRPGSREDRAERTANAMRILREQAYPSADDGRGGKAPGDPTTGLLPFPKSP